MDVQSTTFHIPTAIAQTILEPHIAQVPSDRLPAIARFAKAALLYSELYGGKLLRITSLLRTNTILRLALIECCRVEETFIVEMCDDLDLDLLCVSFAVLNCLYFYEGLHYQPSSTSPLDRIVRRFVQHLQQSDFGFALGMISWLFPLLIEPARQEVHCAYFRSLRELFTCDCSGLDTTRFDLQVRCWIELLQHHKFLKEPTVSVIKKPFVPRIGVGWRNTGNTCFLAATVNFLFLTTSAMEIFSESLSLPGTPLIDLVTGHIKHVGPKDSPWSESNEILEEDSEPPTAKEWDFLHELLKCLVFAQLSNRKVLNLTRVTELCPIGVGGSQEDVFELLMWILNKLCRTNFQVLCDTFRVVAEKRVECQSCGGVRYVADRSFAMILPLVFGEPGERANSSAVCSSHGSSGFRRTDDDRSTDVEYDTSFAELRVQENSSTVQEETSGKEGTLIMETREIAVTPANGEEPVSGPPTIIAGGNGSSHVPQSMTSNVSVGYLNSESSSVTTQESSPSTEAADELDGLGESVTDDEDSSIIQEELPIGEAAPPPTESCPPTDDVFVWDNPAQKIKDRNGSCGIRSISELVNGFLNVERVDDYRCESCAVVGNCECSLKLVELPSVLTITLSRFQLLGSHLLKNNSPVRLEKYLSIPRKESSGSIVIDIYELFLSVIHIGNDLNAGHYTVIGRHGPGPTTTNDVEDDAWFLLDDHEISQTNYSALQAMALGGVKTPYILTYRKTMSLIPLPIGFLVPPVSGFDSMEQIHNFSAPPKNYSPVDSAYVPAHLLIDVILDNQFGAS